MNWKNNFSRSSEDAERVFKKQYAELKRRCYSKKMRAPTYKQFLQMVGALPPDKPKEELPPMKIEEPQNDQAGSVGNGNSADV